MKTLGLGFGLPILLGVLSVAAGAGNATQECNESCVASVTFNPSTGVNTNGLCNQGGTFGFRVTVMTVSGVCYDFGAGCDSLCRFDVTVDYQTNGNAPPGCGGSTFDLTGAECGNSITPVTGLPPSQFWPPVVIYTNTIYAACGAVCPANYTLTENPTGNNIRVNSSLRCSPCE